MKVGALNTRLLLGVNMTHPTMHVKGSPTPSLTSEMMKILTVLSCNLKVCSFVVEGKD